jgi:hypothetical protein
VTPGAHEGASHSQGAALTPLSVDGMIVAASTTLLAESRSGGRGSLLSWVLLVVGSAASLAANVAVAEPTVSGRIIAAWPWFALIGSYELLMRQIRASATAEPPERRDAGSSPALATGLAPRCGTRPGAAAATVTVSLRDSQHDPDLAKERGVRIDPAPHRRRAALRAAKAVVAGGWSDVNDRDPLGLDPARFLGQALHIGSVAGQQNSRPLLRQRDDGDERVERAAVSGQPGPPE